MLPGWLNVFRLTSNRNVGNNIYSHIFVQTRDYAVRKGTRERFQKKKKQAIMEKAAREAAKKRQIMKKKKKVEPSPLLALMKSSLPPAVDDVWVMKFHSPPEYSLQEAIECHRETHHPTMYNNPDAYVNAFIELNMKFENRNKYIDRFTKILNVPHVFEHDVKFKTLALSKDFEQQESAKAAGADFVGGSDVVKQIQAGRFDFKEYDYILAHADILTELLLIRGLLKKKFPNPKAGTVSSNLHNLVTKFKNAVVYTVSPDEVHKDYAKVEVMFGKLNMDASQLEDNFAALLTEVEAAGVKRQGPFIQRVQVTSSPSPESFTVDVSKYLLKKDKKDEESDEVGVIDTE